MLGGACGFDVSLDLSGICARVVAAQGGSSLNWSSCENAYFSASVDGGLGNYGGAPYLLAADARLDNRHEIISRLGIVGEPSDAYLLLTAWEQLGAGALDLVIGDFAFALFDRERCKLILVRDAAGQRPLFYRLGNHGAAFASIPYALRSLGSAPPDLLAIADQLLGTNGTELPSFFANIHCVGIGQYVEIDRAGCRATNWWKPRIDCEDFDRDFPDPVETYRAMLDEAVRCRITSSPPVATHLSSGYDSSAVTATAARLAGHRDDVVAFTSVPAANFESHHVKGRIADEFSGAATVTARYGLRHIRVPPRTNLLDHIRGFGARIHQPILVPINISWWIEIRERAATMGAKHILTGQNGNLSISAGGYSAFSDYILRGDWSGWLREVRSGAQRHDMSLRGTLFNSFDPWIPRRLATRLRRHFLGSRLVNEFVRPEWREQSRIDAAEAKVPRSYGAGRVAVYRTDDSALLAKFALIDHGITENDPTSDRRMVEFSLRWPPERLLFQGKSRPLARAALADRLPAALLDSSLRGLQSADWHLHVTQTQARDLLDEMRGNADAERLLDLSIMSQAIDRWPVHQFGDPAVQFRYGIQLVAALMAGLFLVQHSSHPDDNRPSILD